MLALLWQRIPKSRNQSRGTLSDRPSSIMNNQEMRGEFDGTGSCCRNTSDRDVHSSDP
jgi:hypothetical protein